MAIATCAMEAVYPPHFLKSGCRSAQFLHRRDEKNLILVDVAELAGGLP